MVSVGVAIWVAVTIGVAVRVPLIAIPVPVGVAIGVPVIAVIVVLVVGVVPRGVWVISPPLVVVPVGAVGRPIAREGLSRGSVTVAWVGVVPVPWRSTARWVPGEDREQRVMRGGVLGLCGKKSQVT